MARQHRLLCALALLPTLSIAACDLEAEEEQQARAQSDSDWGDGEIAIPCDEEQAVEAYACETDQGEAGHQQCLLVDDDDEFWSACTTQEDDCTPGDNYQTACETVTCEFDGQAFVRQISQSDECEDITPLVLNFEGGPVEFAPVAAATFDLSSNNTCTNTAWPTSPWLALDRDGDGMIRSGAELFGSATAMTRGGFAKHGFAALAELDSNLDGKIDAQDERFGELVLWSDLDDDRIGAYAELRPLAQSTVVSIDLGFSRRSACDAMGNCGIERAAFEYRRGGDTQFGEVVDVHLQCQ